VISILIVSFNSAPELVACLDSIARCATAIPHGSVEAVRRRFPSVQLIPNEDWYKSLIQWHDTLKSVVQHDVVL